MGFGSDQFGFGKFGYELLPTVNGPKRKAPVAIFYDPETRTFPLLEGELVPIHPVDQAVALSLGVPLGSLAHQSGVGIDQAKLLRTLRQRMQATVTDEVRRCLKVLIDAGHIRLIGSPLTPDANGRPIFYVDYENLATRTKSQKKVNVLNG